MTTVASTGCRYLRAVMPPSPSSPVKHWLRRSLLLAFCVSLMGISVSSQAQVLTDSTGQTHSVRKATVLSAVLPGAGQVYNQKYWKVPIIYGAFAGMGYLIHFNNRYYHDFNTALIARLDSDPNTVDHKYQGKYTDDNLRTLSDYYHRNRDLCVVVTTFVYILNIVDAHVDAHLFNFRVDDNLSLQWQPEFSPGGYLGQGPPAMTLGVHLQF